MRHPNDRAGLRQKPEFCCDNNSSRNVTLIYMTEVGKTLKNILIKANGGRWERDETKPSGWQEVLKRRYRIQHPQTGATFARGDIKFRDRSDFSKSRKNVVWGELTTTPGARDAKLHIKKWKKTKRS